MNFLQTTENHFANFNIESNEQLNTATLSYIERTVVAQKINYQVHVKNIPTVVGKDE